MIQFTPEQIQDNWKELIQLIEDTFEGERQDKLLKMYNHFEDRMCVAPASGTEHFHLCTPGGYVRHILNIVHFSLAFHKTWKDSGAIVDDYTLEELTFAAIHHDLGKVGDMEQDYYIPNESEWHVKNQGKYYINNPELQFMTPPDRGIWILNQFGIKMSVNEMIGIKLTDGMYDEGNIQYLKSYAPEKKLKTNMPLILHQADMATTRIEYEDWIRDNNKEEIKVQGRVENIKKAVTMDETSEQLTQKSKDLFDELFGDK
tara:strand:+ start:2036 stop:2812 length:777 start_codon:yes stop_codon:yes gene_type:complete